MKSNSNTLPRHVTTFHVQFNGALLQQCCRETKSRHIFTRFLHMEIPLTCFKCHFEAVYFKKQVFFQRKLHVSWNYS